MGDPDALTGAMRRFYNLFPYPNRFFLKKPPPWRHVWSHGGFWLGRLDLLKKQKHLSDRLVFRLAQNHFSTDKTILLVGCGTDEPLLFHVLHPNHAITAVDLSEASVKQAQKKLWIHSLIKKLNPFSKKSCGNVSFYIDEAANYLSKNSHLRFDYIQCFGVLHHQKNSLRLLMAMSRALKTGGILRMMVYSYHGRQAERKIQRRYKQLWAHRKLFRIYGTAIVLWLWQFSHIFGAFRATKWRFRYLGLGSMNRVADAFLHPSDPGLSLEQLRQETELCDLKLLYCKGLCEQSGWVSESLLPEQAWAELEKSDRKQDLLSNVIGVWTKTCYKEVGYKSP